MKHWSFRATKATFDGARLTREASLAGLSVVTVSAGSVSATLATRDFLFRLRKHGLLRAEDWLESIGLGGQEFCLDVEGQLYTQAVTSRCLYFARSLLPASEIEALVTALKKAEATPARYAVRGWE